MLDFLTIYSSSCSIYPLILLMLVIFLHGLPLKLTNLSWFNITIFMVLLSCIFILVFVKYLLCYQILKTGNLLLQVLEFFYHVLHLFTLTQVPCFFVIGCCDSDINNSMCVGGDQYYKCEVEVGRVYINDDYNYLDVVSFCVNSYEINLRLPILILCNRNRISNTLPLSDNTRDISRYVNNKFSVII